MSNNKSKSKKKLGETIIEGTIIFIISYVLAYKMDIPRYGHSIRNAKQKQCFSNQRLVTGAIEMYNMDNKEMIIDLNPETYDLLIKGKYLKENWRDECECEFCTDGDLTVDGFIYCENHGSENRKIEGKNINISVTPKKDEEQKRESEMRKFAIAVGPTLFYLLLRLL